MQPKTSLLQTTRLQRIGIIICALVLLFIAGYSVFSMLTFRVTGTTPSLDSVSNISPFIKVSFNKSLKADSLQYSTSYGFVTSTKVEGKTVTFNLNSQLTVDNNYSITIKRIESAAGKVISNKVLPFTIKDLSTDDLTDDEQKTLMDRQDKYVYEVDAIYFKSFDYLTEVGLTASQEQNVKEAIFGYSKTINKQFTNVILNTGSVRVSAPGQTESSVDVAVTADSTPYNLHITYSGLDNAYTIISDASGKEVYRDTAEVFDDNGE